MNKQTLTSQAISFSSCSYQVAILVSSHSHQTMFRRQISDAFRSSWYGYTFMSTYFIFSLIFHANRLGKTAGEISRRSTSYRPTWKSDRERTSTVTSQTQSSFPFFLFTSRGHFKNVFVTVFGNVRIFRFYPPIKAQERKFLPDISFV